MAAPIAGLWKQLNGNVNDYAGALKWGTGASDVYAQFGEGPPTGITGRFDSPGVIAPAGTGRAYDPYREVPSELLSDEEWGYTPEDMTPGTFADFMETDFPNWTQRPEVTRDTSGVFPPPTLLARPNGPSGKYFHTIHQPGMLEDAITPHSYPTETVTEGWEHKEHGEVLTAEVSDTAQYERQTSMQQVDPPAGRNNDLAVARGTDDPRFYIRTRLTGMKIKPWSEGQRLADMFPYQQDLILRPFWFRNASTGRVEWLVPNEFQEMTPLQRTPPTEPDYGPNESTGADKPPDYGYAPEDYYG